MPRSHERTNLAMWERYATTYERRNAAILTRGHDARGWGLFHLPERRLHILGDVRGRDVLELGCGAARWAVALARRGARMVGLDFSPARLAQARTEMQAAGVEFPLVEASAERIPFPDARFDVVFCDFGAVTFTDPYRTVPEVARVLRPGGLFAFSNNSPFRSMCLSKRSDRISARLRYDYFDLHRLNYPGEVNFQLPYGGWVRLFRESGLVVEDLIEPRAPRKGGSSYLTGAEVRFGRHWPLEVIWRLRKDPSPRRPRQVPAGRTRPRGPEARTGRDSPRGLRSRTSGLGRPRGHG
jgi:ubiquinone/menaquinone biosynthesis C-methylase UbiE